MGALIGTGHRLHTEGGAKNQLKFPEEIKEPRGEGEVQGNEVSKSNGEGIKADWSPADGIPGRSANIGSEVEPRVKVEEIGKEEMESMPDIKKTSESKTSPKQLVFEDQSTLAGQLKGNLGDGKCEALSLYPVVLEYGAKTIETPNQKDCECSPGEEGREEMLYIGKECASTHI